MHRTMHVGAEPLSDDEISFRVWAPESKRVELVLVDDLGTIQATEALEPAENGYHSLTSRVARVGSRYFYRLDQQEKLFPDPASRFQPDGPHGPSEVININAYSWRDQSWKGVELPGQVIYEMHVGTFTREGTWSSAEQMLPKLKELGISVIEMMPVADFPGRFGWGYDGVNLFAPTRLYGRPDDLRRFVDTAHGLGMGVVLDVVYNHLGPDGNYLPAFSSDYLSRNHRTEWGEAINYDGKNSRPVREYFVANAVYWLREFHFDGLRLDATQDIYDDSEEHFLSTLTRELRRAIDRHVLLVAENEPQRAQLVRPPEQGGYGLDAIWNDDFHHTALVLLSGRNEAYYSDYQGRPQEFISAIKHGFLYQGQWYQWQQKRRGAPAWDVPPAQFVHYIQNHDQVANSALGLRAHSLTSPGRYKAMTALLLLAPQTPMLFQGQEFAASSPFLYFADHYPELATLVAKGRKEFLCQFPTVCQPETQAQLASPGAESTFMRCKLKWDECELHSEIFALHRDLLQIRREDPTFRQQRLRSVDGAILGDHAFVLRFFGEAGADRLLIINFGSDLVLCSQPEPLLAPMPDHGWQVMWSSEEVRYGGSGTPPIDIDGNWRLPGQTAMVLQPA